MTESDILYENGRFWVSAEVFGSGRFRAKSSGYAVWESGVTHSTRRAIIGYAGEKGFARAREAADRMAAEG